MDLHDGMPQPPLTGPAHVPHDRIEVVPHDPRWAAMFQEERTRIVAALGIAAADVEHIGSTAVPGLAAKPILDIMLGMDSPAQVAARVVPLAALGYEHQGELGIPGRTFFRKGNPWTHHLHAVQRESKFWVEHLLFRDHLRAHPEVAREYEALKRALAARFPDDREAYNEGKTAFIRSVVERARAD